MSDTSSNQRDTPGPGSIIGAAILEALEGGAAGHRRLFLGSYLGADPADVFDALVAEVDHEIRIPAGNGVEPLGAIRRGGASVIPYLVTPPGDAGVNRGSQGFAALLRSAFTSGAEGPRVLLVFDREPVETVRTAAEDAALLPQLDWKALCRRAAACAAGAASGFLSAVAEDFAGRARPSVAALGDLLTFCTTSWPDAASAAASLHLLGPYLSDPDAAGNYARFTDGSRWRSRIDGWTAPGSDLPKQLARRLGPSHPAIQAILDARRPFGLDYSRFTLGDLLHGPPPPPEPLRLALPLSVDGATATAEGFALAVWVPGGTGGFRIHLAGTPRGDEVARLDLPGPEQVSCSIDAGGGGVTVKIAGSAGWSFGELYMVSAGSVHAVRLAVYSGVGSWFPIERALDIQPDAAAFAVEGEPEALALAPGGRVLGPAALELALSAREGDVVTPDVYRAGERHPLPLLLLGAGGGEPPAGSGAAADERDNDGDADDDDHGGEPGSGGHLVGSAAASAAHALLDASRRPDAPPGSVTFQAEAGGAWITVGTQRRPLADQTLGSVNGLDIERQILRNPRNWAFSLRRSADGSALAIPEPALERLSLENLDQGRLAAFSACREALFGALRASGSAHAIAAGCAGPEAAAYVAAYSDLLSGIQPGTRYQPEYDRLLLVDSILDPLTGDMLIAPTNPVTVALLLAFGRSAASWVTRGAVPGEREVDAIGPRHLLPLFMLNGEWHESLAGQPFPWRRYARMSQGGARPDDDQGFIASRIDFFLDVHPAYRDRRQLIAVTFYDPGDGEAVAGALRDFYRPDASATRLTEHDYTRPALDVYLVSPTRDLPGGLARLLAESDGSGVVDRLVRSRVRVTMLGRDAHPEFSHLAFVFRSPADRSPWPVEMSSRAATTYAGGLATAAGRATLPSANELAFAWGTFATTVCGDAGAPAESELLGRATRQTLELVGAQPRELIEAGVTRMPTTRVEPGFLPEIYSRSVWVVHLDRLLGLEAFAPGAGESTRYLIDYEERADPTQPGLDAITATERVEAYLDALTRALTDLGSPTDSALSRILRLLNAVSGRWALQLLHRSPGQLRERIGTVAAIAAVQELDRGFPATGRFGVMVPLDEVFKSLRAAGAAPPVRPACDDLLYLSVPERPGPVAVRGRLLEVKFRSAGVPDMAIARAELESTMDWLARAFNQTGALALFRGRDLAELIRTSATRGNAFGLSAPPGPSHEAALQSIASGDYSLDFEYWVGTERLEGDVVSVEAESSVPATRSRLPGAGRPLGLVRLGRSCLERLASGRQLPRPDSWVTPAFDPPSASSTAGRQGGVGPDHPESRSGRQAGSGAEQPRAGAAGSEPQGGPGADPQHLDRHGGSEAEVRRIVGELDAAALKYGLDLEPFRPDVAQVGPSVIRFRTRALGKQTLSGVQRVALDIGREVGVAAGVLVDQEPYYLTVDVPRAEPEVVAFADYAPRLDEAGQPGALRFLVGMAPSGDVRVEDLARLPHLLVAGATGSGKSVFLRGLVAALARGRSPEQLRVLLVDPKQVDFLPFEDLPHLMLGGIISDPAEAVTALSDMIEHEVAVRRPVLKEAGVTSALEFYEAGHLTEELPQIVVLVDEFADLAATLEREDRALFMSVIQRYGQLTRAFGIYLVLATQRPSVQVITGDIKANLTARVALKVQAPQDSVTILGRGGAERLRDRGDLLFDHAGRTERLQAFLATSADARAAVGRWLPGGVGR